MALKARVLSPAKINLHLEIYPPRGDGYHSLVSVFQMIPLYDEISVCSLTDKGATGSGACSIEGDFDFPAEENIIGKCCAIFRRETGIKTGLAFSVRKRIPQGAGLGGGSSNGAAALRAMNAMFATGLSDEKLAGLGARAGSDIPFFCIAPAALVTGRGDIVTPLRPRGDFFIVLVIPPLRVSTAAAYSWLDAAGRTASPARGRETVLRAMYEGESPANWKFFNSFYPVLREREPVFGEIHQALLGAGALYAAVSGSGCAMFGIFQTENAAEKAEKLLKTKYPATNFFSPLAGMPDVILQ